MRFNFGIDNVVSKVATVYYRNVFHLLLRKLNLVTSVHDKVLLRCVEILRLERREMGGKNRLFFGHKMKLLYHCNKELASVIIQ